MAKLEDLGEVISTDVLIIGGGIGGLVAAIKAKEESPKLDVLMVDKQTIGWSGKAPKGGGVLTFVGPDDDPDKFAEYHIKNIGYYLNDQELLYAYARESYGAVQQLAEWGVKVIRDAEGKFVIFKMLANPWSTAPVDLDMLLPLRARARKAGAKILNKIHVAELLKQDDRVVGAVGFSLIDGRFYIFKAKATVLANGSCNYRVKRMWATGCGDGIAAAYRAGAEMRNAEFGNFFDLHRLDTDSPGGGPGRASLVNALGEDIFKKYVSGPQPDIALELVLGMEKEIREGRGPIYSVVSGPPPSFGSLVRRKADSWRARIVAKEAKYGPPPKEKVEVVASLNAELSCIKVDHEMKTTLAGLWAIGDTSYAGSAMAGAVFAPPARMRGSGLMNAVFSAMRGGPAAARYAAKAASPEVNYAEVKRLKEEIFAPMPRQKGLEPWDAIYAIQEVVCPIKYNLRRSQDHLEEGLSKIKKVQDRLPELVAKDAHYLGKCHEVRSYAVCAEMTLRAALMRTESRGWHFREDYPQRDDKDWLKWVIVKQKGGKMAVSTEPVPIDKYKFKP